LELRQHTMKRPLIALVFSILLILTAKIVSAEPSAFKKPGDYHTDSQLVSEEKSVNLIKFITAEGTIKKDSVPNEVNDPYMYLKLRWDTEEPGPFMQLGHYEERESWQMLHFFLILQIPIP
jgi:hypothetical protein